MDIAQTLLTRKKEVEQPYFASQSFQFVIPENSVKYTFLVMMILFCGCKANLEDLKYDDNLMRGLKIAEELQKPLFVHFTGFGSGGKNEFNQHFISSKKIQDKLNEEFVTIQLFVDDKTKLKRNDYYGLKDINFPRETERKINTAKTKGNLNTLLQIEFFNSNTQPLYVIMNHKRQVIGEPFGYMDNNKSAFLRKLNEGLKHYKETN